MKNLLVLALTLVSVSAMADTLKIKCDSTNRVGGNNGSIGTIPATFSGQVTLTTQEDEVVFADTFVSVLKNEAGALPELVTLEDMHGTRQKINAGELGQSEVTSVSLFSSDDSEVKAYLVLNLGLNGANARLTLDSEGVYSSSCTVESVKAE